MSVLSNLEVVIPSRGRAEAIRDSAALFHNPAVCVGEDEAETYQAFNPKARLMVHPANVVGMGKKRQWILDNCPAEIVFMVDDDVNGLFCIVGNRKRQIKNKDDVEMVIAHAAICAREAGTVLFGFAHTPDVRHFRTQQPVSLTGYVNGLSMGIIGREIQFDQRQTAKEDIDFSLQVLAKKRIIWRDGRYSFQVRKWFSQSGGLGMIRTSEVVEKDTNLLKAKWGKAVEVNHYENDSKGKHVNIRINVTR